VPVAWRIVKTKYAGTAFDGEGARRYGGRWTSPHRRAVYTSSTLALATLELVVHLEQTRLLAAYSVFDLAIPDELVAEVDVASLPKDWREYPPPATVRIIGDGWLDAANTAVLKAPSAVVGREFNYLLNPAHEDFRRIAISPAQPYSMDERLNPWRAP
jgi:RES domain-containing protein